MQGFWESSSAVRAVSENRVDMRGFKKLSPRDQSDPMKLHQQVLEELDDYFSTRGLTYLSGQRELLAEAAEAVLKASPGKVTAIPFQPGLGKSTLIRALLAVFSCEFRQNTSIAQALGGVVVVVEKTAEAEELEELCNGPGERTPVAKAISAPNDYNLAQGKCFNGTATSYQECPGRSCSDYADCELAQSASQIHDTPILIILHARYQRSMEEMTPFLTWDDDAGAHTRTLLLVDELPPMIEDNVLNIAAINQIESEIAQFKPSYQAQARKEKDSLLCEWGRRIRIPFQKLRSTLRNHSGMFGMVFKNDMESAGFTQEGLQKLKNLLMDYFDTEAHHSLRLVNALITANGAYYAVGQDIALFFPRLLRINGECQPATFLFSGTASLSPELSENPDIDSFPDRNLESFHRLQINVQRGDQFNSSKTGLARKRNQAALVAWLQSIVPQAARTHNRILVVTYKKYAASLWNALQEYHNVLISYIGNDGQAQSLLPYFGGLNGSNLYREATCVICAGLNRFEPRDYISRAIALDFDGTNRDEINAILETLEGKMRLEGLPCVMKMQDVTLARDVVQLVFRSALRNHGGNELIELWLPQPPNGVIGYLCDYFGDCRIEEFAELPESCQIAATVSQEYLGQQTHAGKLLSFLNGQADGARLTPAQIREATGLTPGQFKEAKKHKAVQEYFQRHFRTAGSGKNTVYTKLPYSPAPTVDTVSA